MNHAYAHPDEGTRKVTVRAVVDRISGLIVEPARTFWAVYDTFFRHYRSKHPITDDWAWTRDKTQRAEFATPGKARAELARIARYRQKVADLATKAPTVGARVRTYRKIRHMTQGELALACGFNAASRIADIEADRSAPTVTTMLALADGLSVRSADLLPESPIRLGGKVRLGTD